MQSLDASALAREAEHSKQRLVADAPALAQPGWLPEGQWPELDVLRADHNRIVGQRNEVGHERIALRRQFEAEGAAHNEELTAAYGEGREPRLPALTPAEDRRLCIGTSLVRTFDWSAEDEWAGDDSL